MLIYSGKNISDRKIVTRIQRRSPMAKYYDYCGERKAMEKADDLQGNKEGLSATRIRGQFRFKKNMLNKRSEHRSRKTLSIVVGYKRSSSDVNSYMKQWLSK